MNMIHKNIDKPERVGYFEIAYNRYTGFLKCEKGLFREEVS